MGVRMQVHTCIGRIGVGGGDISAGKSCRPSCSVIAVLGHGLNLIEQPLFLGVSAHTYIQNQEAETLTPGLSHM